MMKKKFFWKKKNCTSDRLLDTDHVTVNWGLDSAKMLDSLQKHIIPQEYRERIYVKFRSREEFQHIYKEYDFLREYEIFLNEMCAQTGEIQYPCYCEVCGSTRNMIVLSSDYIDGHYDAPNWRETVICPDCGFNNHLRFLIGKIQKDYEDGIQLLIFEDDAMLYDHVRKKFPGAEAAHIGPGIGLTADFDVCYEQNKWCDGEFQMVIANDIWEKVGNFDELLKKISKIVARDGKLIFTTVFDANSDVSRKGVFGWDILDRLKDCGFEEAYAVTEPSIKDGYLGYLPIYFEAIKK